VRHAGPPWRDGALSRDVVDSTMEEARALALAGAPHGTSVMARQQRAGRGRHGRVWASPPGAGLYLTVLLVPPQRATLQGLPLVFGAGLLAAVHALGATRAELKWPNDVLVGGAKLAGLLLEATLAPAPRSVVLVGVGLNLAAQAPECMRDARLCGGAADGASAPLPYTGLAAHLPGPAPGPDAALGTVLDHLQRAWDGWGQHGLAEAHAAFERHHALAGRRVRAQGTDGRPISGTVLGIHAEGGLRLATAQGEQIITAGEVTGLRPHEESA
jgi:BirA family biotin operon repressor/biotin-[acetyl-CoA-carboxylase] ligase